MLQRSRCILLVVLLALAGSCTEHSTELSPLRDARISLRPSFVLNGGSETTLPITRIRLTATEVGTNIVLETATETVDPAADTWSLDFSIPIRGTTRVVVSIELIHVTAEGAEIVEWSGVTGELTLRPGSAQSEGLSVFPGPLDNLLISALAIADVPQSLTEGEGALLRAAITAPAGINARVFWSSSNESVLVVDAGGRVQALRPGNARITVQAGLLSAHADIIVRARGASITISPAAVTLDHLGAETALSAVVLDPRGDPLPAVPITWTIGDPSVLIDLGDGRFRAIGVGTTTVRAAIGASPAINATASVTVTQRAASVEVSPPSTLLDARGATVQLNATARDAGGATLPPTAVTWSTSNPAIAIVDQNGLVTAVANGTANIRAEAGTASGSAEVRVALLAAQLNVVSGNAQSANGGSELTEPIVVRALDRLGNPLGGVEVTFIAGSGGSANPASVSTGTDGQASTRWTLGSAPGAQELRAVAENLTAIISATALGRTATTLVVHAGNDQSATVNTAVALAPAVRITDAAGQPMAGIVVTFAVVSGGGSIAGGTPTTDANGVATLGSWTLGTTAGAQQISAAAEGLAPVTFHATATADVAASIAIVSGNGQTGRIGTELSQSLVVRVADRFGNAVAGVTVAFTANGGGTANPTAAVTMANGSAATRWTLGNQSGAQELRATVSGLPDAVFTATAEGGTASSLIIHAGDSQGAEVGTAVTVPPAVRVTDSFGAPVAGVTVTFAVTSGGGAATGATAVTDANGVGAVGSWTLGNAPGTNHLSATANGLTVTFTATATAGPPASIIIVSGNTQSARISTQLPAPLVVRVEDRLANPLAGVSVSFATASGGSANPAQGVTAANGEASTQWTLGAQAGPQELRASVPGLSDAVFTATAEAALATALVIHAGNNQSATVGQPVAVQPAVRVTDASGAAVAGVTVTFSVVAGGGIITGATPTTNADGVATLGSWIMGTTPVVNQINATIAGVDPVTFNATATPGPPASLMIASGNGQSARLGTQLAEPLVVRVADEFGNGLAGVNVAFTTTTGTANPTAAATGSDGNASTLWTLGTQPGAQELRASVTGLTDVVFNATAQGGTASFVTIHAGNTQSASTGTAVAVPPAVRVTDQFEAPVAGVTVTFEVVSGGGSITGATALTDANGVATIGSWTLGSTAGTNELRATVTGLTPVVFTATATAHTPAISLALADGHTNVGVSFHSPLRVMLSAPAPAGGVTVTVVSNNTAKLRVESTGTVVIAAGASEGTIQLEGVEAGTATLTATASGHTSAQLAVTVSLRLISLPLTLNVPYGQTASLPIQLAEPAPAGGVVVSLVSADETLVRVLTPTVTIAAGSSLGSATVEGALPGTANVTANAAGFIGATSSVTTRANLDIVETSLRLNASFGNQFTIRLRSAGSPIAAPAGGVQVSFNAVAPLCAAVPATATIPQGLTQINVPVTYGGDATLPCTSRVHATAENILPDSLNVTVDPTPVISFNFTNVGAGLQRQFSVHLNTTTHDGVTIRIASADATRLLLAPDANTVGAGTLDVTLPAGTSGATFFAQAPGGTGSVVITGTATQATTGSATINILQPAIDIIGLPTFTTTLTANDAFQVRIGLPGGANAFLTESQAVRAGSPPVVVTVQSDTPAVALLATSAGTAASRTVEIAATQFASPGDVPIGGVALDPVGAGATVVRASAPGVITTTNAIRSVTVSAPTINMVNPMPVGAGLMRSQNVTLGATTHGGVTVRVTSSDPSRLLVAANGSSTGSAFIDVPLLNGDNSFSYVTQAIEAATGNVTVTATAPGFADGSASIPIMAPAVDISGAPSSMTTTSPDDAFIARIGIPNSTNAFINEVQTARTGGPGFQITFETSAAAVATLVTSAGTASSVTLLIAAGQSSTASTVAAGGVAVRPLSAGSANITASGAELISTTTAVRALTVTSAGMTMTAFPLGAGLQRFQNGTLLGSDHGGVTVRVRSTQPDRLLVAPNATTAGTEFIDIAVANGTTSFSYVAQALDGLTGSVTLTATAPGFSDGTTTVDVVQPALDIIGLNTSVNTLSADDPFIVRVGIPNSTGAFLNEVLARRFGGDALTATVTSSTTAGQIVTQSAAGGSGTTLITANTSSSPSSVASGGVAFRPFSGGSTVVAATIPGFRVLPSSQATVTVSAPAITLNSVTVGAGLQRSITGSLSSAAHGGVTVRISSSNSGVALVSPNATTAGAGEIDIVVPNNVGSFSYYVHGIEGAVATVALHATASGFTDGSATATVVQPGLDISGLNPNPSTISPADLFAVRIGVPHSSGNFLNELQALRAGAPALAVTVTTSNAGHARLATSTASGASVTLTIAAGASSTPGSLAAGGVQLEPVAAGSATISAQIPGFILTAGTVDVTVAPATLSMTGVTVGAGLQRFASFSVNGSNHGGITVRLTSADPSRLVLAPSNNTAGAGTLDISLPAGVTSISYAVQGLEDVTGNVGVEATATGFVSGNATMTVAQPAFDISGLLTNISSTAANDPFTIRVGLPNSLLTFLQETQTVRPGSPGLTVSVASSNAAVGRLVTAADTGSASVTVTIPANSSSTAASVATGGVAFDPLAIGSTNVSALITGLRSLPTSTVTVNVN